MNTPTHILLSYALLRKRALNKKDVWSIVIGGILPDAVIFFLFFWAVSTGIPQKTLWSETYFEPFWQNMIDCFNSVPLLIVVALIAAAYRWRTVLLLVLSMLIHTAGDIFLHNDDAHRHFFPFSDWKLVSPISYWDPDHYGWLGTTIEIIILAGALYWSWKYITSRTVCILIIIYIALILIMLVLTPLIFTET